MAAILALIKSKTIIGSVILGVGLVDKLIGTPIPDVIAGVLVAAGTVLAGVGARHAVEKAIVAAKAVIDAIDAIKKNPNP